MRINKKEREYPILVGYPYNEQLACWCPYCACYHYHGDVEGERVAHCNSPYSPFKKTGYYIKRATSTELACKNIKILQSKEYPKLKE